MMLDIAGGILIAAFIIAVFVLGLSFVNHPHEEDHLKGFGIMGMALVAGAWIVFFH